jgi:phosphohistidine phosphatase SixA
VPIPCPELEAGHSPADALAAAHRHGEGSGKAVALVGHEPLLGDLAALLVTGQASGASFVFKKGAVACFELLDQPLVPGRSIPTSRPGRMVTGTARLLWLAQPKLLRALAR